MSATVANIVDGRTLEGWLRWHHKLLAVPVAGAERLLSGSLEYSPADFVGAGKPVRSAGIAVPATTAAPAMQHCVFTGAPYLERTVLDGSVERRGP